MHVYTSCNKYAVPEICPLHLPYYRFVPFHKVLASNLPPGSTCINMQNMHIYIVYMQTVTYYIADAIQHACNKTVSMR